MGFNSKEIKVEPTKEIKKNPYSKDIITDPRGQWAHPGKITKIPSGNITMKGVPYPVLGIDNLGNQQLMHPGLDYTFPGQSVTEYPQERRGGSIRDLYYNDINRRLPSSNPATGINEVMMRNTKLYGLPGKHRFVPPKQEGGSMNDDAFIPGPTPEEIEEFKKGGGFHINPAHKGWCTPMTKPTCTGKRRQFAINAKHHFKKQEDGGPVYGYGGPSNGPLGYFLPGGENSNEQLYFQKMGGVPCVECDKMNVGGSPFNYGAFPAMMSGGDVTSIMHGLAKKQYGGGDQSQAPSTESILEDKKNFFNNYIRNNVSKAVANELINELQGKHIMPDGSMMNNSDMPKAQYGQPWNPGYGQNMNYPEGWDYNTSDGANQQTLDQYWNTKANQSPTPGSYGWNPQSLGVNQPLPWEDPNAVPSNEASQTDIDRMYAGKSAQFVPTQGAEMAKIEDSYFSTPNPYANETSIPGLSPNPNLATYNPNAPQAPEVQNITMDSNQMRTNRPKCTEEEKRDPKSKCYKPSSSFEFSFTTPNHAEQILTAENSISSLLERSANAKWEKDNKWRESGDANFIAQTRNNRGDYDINSGDFRPNEKVPVQFRGSNYGNIGSTYQLGGSQDNEQDEQWLDDEEIEQIKRMGGKVTYL